MNKKELIICGVFAGLLVKIIRNQKILDDHIYYTNRAVNKYYDGTMYKYETLRQRTIINKIKDMID